MVYEAHEALHDFVSSAAPKRRTRRTADDNGDIDAFRMYDESMEFLRLDDVLPVDLTGRGIDLPSSRSEHVNTTQVESGLDTTLPNTENANHGHNNNNVTLLSLGGILSTTRDSSHSIPRHSFASPRQTSRMLMQTLQKDAGWRLLGSDVDTNGALVMPGAVKSVFVNGEVWSEKKEEMEEMEEVQIFPEGEFGGEEYEEFVDDAGVGFELNDAYDENDARDDKEETIQQEQEKEKQEVSKKEKVSDPCETLDPHQPSCNKSLPLKIGVTYRLPAGINEGDVPSKAVTGSRTRKVKSCNVKTQYVELDRWQKSPFVTDWIHKAANDDESPEKPFDSLDWLCDLKESLYGDEFAYLAKKYAKHFDAIARQKREELAVEGHDQAVPDEDDYDYNDYGGGFDYGGDDDHSYTHNDAMDHPETHPNRSNVDFAAIDDVFATSSPLHHENEHDHNPSYQTFEQLCQAHLVKFAKSAEIYAAETQLAKRVSTWQEGLAPILEEQEKRPEFDIHEIGKEILECVEDRLSTRKRNISGQKKLDDMSANGDKSNIVGFRQLSKDKEEYEVCRLFLSTLMLCNCGNLIVHDEKDVGSTESLQVELLNTKFEGVMKEFLAPSAIEEENMDPSRLNVS